jgi:hypothetical protein
VSLVTAVAVFETSGDSECARARACVRACAHSHLLPALAWRPLGLVPAWLSTASYRSVHHVVRDEEERLQPLDKPPEDMRVVRLLVAVVAVVVVAVVVVVVCEQLWQW